MGGSTDTVNQLAARRQSRQHRPSPVKETTAVVRLKAHEVYWIFVALYHSNSPRRGAPIFARIFLFLQTLVDQFRDPLNLRPPFAVLMLIE
jgi:hypothetical protein